MATETIVDEAVLRSERPERRGINQSRLFLLWLFLGIVSIGIARFIGGALLFGILGVGVPMLLIVAYATWNWREDFEGTTRDVIADNSYYLGFLYFLASLGFSLIRFDVEHPNVEQIVHGFGTALFTSITGLGARILLLQSGRETIEDAQGAQRELNATVARFKASLESSSDLIRAATGGISQTIIAHEDQLVGHSTAAIQKISISVSDSLKMIETRLQSIEIPEDMLTKRFDPAMTSLGVEVESLAQEVKHAAADLRLAASGFGGSVGKLGLFESQLSTMMERAERALGQLPQQAEAVATLNRTLVEANGAISEMVKAIGEIAMSVEDLSVRTKAITERAEFGEIAHAAEQGARMLNGLSQSAASGTASLATMERASSGAAAVIDRLAASADRITSSSDKLVEAELKVAEQLSAALGGVGQIVLEVNRLIEFQRVAVAPTEELRRKTDEVVRRLAELTSAVQQLSTKETGIRSWFSR